MRLPPPTHGASCRHSHTQPLRARSRPTTLLTAGTAPQPLSHAKQRSPTPAPSCPQRTKRPSTLTAAAPAAPGGQPRDPWSPSCRRALSWVKWPASFRRGLEPPHSGSTSSLIAMARGTDGARPLRAAPGPGATPGRRQAERPAARSGSPPTPRPGTGEAFLAAAWAAGRPSGNLRLPCPNPPGGTPLASQPTRPQAAGRGPVWPRPRPHGSGSAARPPPSRKAAGVGQAKSRDPPPPPPLHAVPGAPGSRGWREGAGPAFKGTGTSPAQRRGP